MSEPIRPAATVIIVRDAEPQFEIFMLRRTNSAVFAGGMYVFPGGRVDDDDAASAYRNIINGPDVSQSTQQQALGENWQQYWLTGIRETFEEAGFLLAYDQHGEILAFDETSHDRFHSYRQQLHDGDISLSEICEVESLTLALDRIHFFNRWITPPGRPRRFDTRFFITAAPVSQTGLHDGHETVDSLWISPNEALTRYRDGDLGLMKVTEMQLANFSQYTTADEFLLMAKDNRSFPTYDPGSTPA